MKLSDNVLNLINIEYKLFKDKMYADSPVETRDELGQFFTPAELTIKMIESYGEDFTKHFVLDPCCGSGNLLAGCIIAGVDPSNIFGNEYDPRMVHACRERIKTIPDRLEEADPEFAAALRTRLLNFKDWQIHRGDATDFFCIDEFGEEYPAKLRQHYLDQIEQRSGTNLFGWELTEEQEAFLREVD